MQPNNKCGQRYDAEFKENAVALVKSGRTLRAVAGDLGVSTWSLRRWVAVQGKLPVMSLLAGGIFEASLLLFDRVWDKRELGIEGEIVVAVPSRELLLVTDSSNAAGMTRI